MRDRTVHCQCALRIEDATYLPRGDCGFAFFWHATCWDIFDELFLLYALGDPALQLAEGSKCGRSLYTMRRRIFFGLAPIFVLIVAMGAYAVLLFAKLGTQVDVILRENFRSVLAGQQIK